MVRDRASKVSGAPFRLSWPAIFGGMFAAAGVWLLLHALGLALGFSHFNPADPRMLRAAGVGSGVWAIVASFLALFAGGVVTARSAGFLGRGNGAVHGVVLWGLTSFAGVFVLTSLVSSLASGLAGVGSQAAAAALEEPGQIGKAVGIDTRDLVEPVNARLREEGKPTVTPEQLQAATRDAVVTGLSQGSFDRELFVAALADNTDLSEPDVRGLFGSIEEQLNQRFASMRSGMVESAEKVATATGRMFWGLFALMVTSLVGSVLGALTGVSRRQREMSVQTAQPPGVLPPIGTRPSEVYP